MKKKYSITLNSQEHDVVVQSLISWKSDLHKRGRYTDAIDELLIKVLSAPPKMK